MRNLLHGVWLTALVVVLCVSFAWALSSEEERERRIVNGATSIVESAKKIVQ
jgi:hypothetical protein